MSTVESCPLCGRTKGMHRKNLLYGHNVCKKCRNAFANRRQLAYFIDGIIAYILQILAGFSLGILLAMTGFTSDPIVEAAGWFVIVFFIVVMIAKDGFSGTSPGKALMGVQAIDQHSGVPIGFGASMMRNLPIVVPIVPLIVGMQLLKGHRWGDGWAGTKVIWRKYADNPVFNDQASAPQPEFPPLAAELAPVRETQNPYQAPRQ